MPKEKDLHERWKRIAEARNSRYEEAEVERLFGRYRIIETDSKLGIRETILEDRSDLYSVVSEKIHLRD